MDLKSSRSCPSADAPRAVASDFSKEPRWSMAAAAMTPRSFETAFSPASFPGVNFIILPPLLCALVHAPPGMDCTHWIPKDVLGPVPCLCGMQIGVMGAAAGSGTQLTAYGLRQMGDLLEARREVRPRLAQRELGFQQKTRDRGAQVITDGGNRRSLCALRLQRSTVERGPNLADDPLRVRGAEVDLEHWDPASDGVQ